MFFKVHDHTLVPMTKEADAFMKKYENGDEIEFEALHPIYSKFNAKMFAAIGMLAKATGVTAEAMRARLLISTGRFDNVQLTPHKTIQVPHSMSRNAMTMRERKEFWLDLREIASSQILPFIDLRVADEIRNIFADQGQHQEEDA
jgi:hypothetical protein